MVSTGAPALGRLRAPWESLPEAARLLLVGGGVAIMPSARWGHPKQPGLAEGPCRPAGHPPEAPQDRGRWGRWIEPHVSAGKATRGPAPLGETGAVCRCF